MPRPRPPVVPLVDHPRRNACSASAGLQPRAAVVDGQSEPFPITTRPRRLPVRWLGLSRGIHRVVDQIAHHGHHG